MKKFIKERWFPLVVAISILILVAGVVLMMVLSGWRFTYAPELENSWDAISAVATWIGVLVSVIGVVASFIAIWYAIQVPKKIADRQDKIALFERRYDCFQLFQDCMLLYKYSKENDTESIYSQCCYMLNIQNIDEIDPYKFTIKGKKFEWLLHQMAFLYSGIDEQDMSTLYKALWTYLKDIVAQKDYRQSKQSYMAVIVRLNKYIDEIWDSITISNIK